MRVPLHIHPPHYPFFSQTLKEKCPAKSPEPPQTQILAARIPSPPDLTRRFSIYACPGNMRARHRVGERADGVSKNGIPARCPAWHYLGNSRWELGNRLPPASGRGSGRSLRSPTPLPRRILSRKLVVGAVRCAGSPSPTRKLTSRPPAPCISRPERGYGDQSDAADHQTSQVKQWPPSIRGANRLAELNRPDGG